jgi:hypothetical protein
MKRSVHGFVPIPLQKTVQVDEETYEAVALLFMGEGVAAPPELGHSGAGKVSVPFLRRN